MGKMNKETYKQRKARNKRDQLDRQKQAARKAGFDTITGLVNAILQGIVKICKANAATGGEG
jgi:hypothetical protein